MTANGIVDIYRPRPFYITIAKIGMTDAHAPKHREVGKVAEVPKEVVHFKGECFSYP